MGLHALDKSIEYRTRRRSSVDVVADEYLDISVAWLCRTISVDAPQHGVEQICAPMHVAHSINARSLFKSRALRVVLPFQGFPHGLNRTDLLIGKKETASWR